MRDFLWFFFAFLCLAFPVGLICFALYAQATSPEAKNYYYKQKLKEIRIQKENIILKKELDAYESRK